MRVIIFLVISSILMYSCNYEKEKTKVTESQLSEMRTLATEFMGNLKQLLTKQIRSNGIVNAASVCSDTAQILTNNFSLQKGVFIRRVSLKNRNVNNTPDAFEIRILRQFEKEIENNTFKQVNEYTEILTVGEHQYLRYMKPIFMNDLCLNCHGTNEYITAEIKTLISEKYPNDKAIGFGKGDLRGAVSITKLIN